MTREDKVLLLLRSMNDWVPGPKVPRYGEGGEGAVVKLEECRACQGTGRAKKDTPCAVCKGTGKVEVDAYTGNMLAPAVSTPTAPEDVQCDACGGEGGFNNGKQCDRCDGKGDVPGRIALAPERPDREDAFGWELLKRKYWRAGSYAPLTHLLESLRLNAPEDYQTARAAIEGAEGPEVSDIVAGLAERMPHRIHVPKWVAPTDGPEKRRELSTGERNTLIRQLYADGTNKTALGRQFNLARSTIAKILEED